MSEFGEKLAEAMRLALPNALFGHIAKLKFQPENEDKFLRKILNDPDLDENIKKGIRQHFKIKD